MHPFFIIRLWKQISNPSYISKKNLRKTLCTLLEVRKKLLEMENHADSFYFGWVWHLHVWLIGETFLIHCMSFHALRILARYDVWLDMGHFDSNERLFTLWITYHVMCVSPPSLFPCMYWKNSLFYPFLGSYIASILNQDTKYLWNSSGYNSVLV